MARPCCKKYNFRRRPYPVTYDSMQGHRKRGGGGGWGRPPNSLLKFVDFVVKRAVKATIVGMKIQTRIYSRKLPESIKNAISFDVIEVKNFKIFMERPSLVVILCFRQWHPRTPAFPHFARTSLQPPPQYEFRSNRPDSMDGMKENHLQWTLMARIFAIFTPAAFVALH